MPMARARPAPPRASRPKRRPPEKSRPSRDQVGRRGLPEQEPDEQDRHQGERDVEHLVDEVEELAAVERGVQGRRLARQREWAG